MNDKVNENTGVRTGGESRSELTFLDLTITRLGANTIFSFSKAGHSTEIDSGSLLFRVPKNSGGGHINSSSVSVAITGTTVILECIRGNRLYVLEGGARISLIKYPSQFQNLRAGQMVDVPPGAKTIPSPTNFDINDLMRKHPLITDFPPLPSRDLIVAAAQERPPQTGPSGFPFVPVINLFGGGSSGGSHGSGQTPPGRPQQQPPTRPPVTGQGASTGTNTTSTPPPGIYRQPPPGKTPSHTAGTTTQTRQQSTPSPKRRIIKQPVQTTNKVR